MEYSPLIKWPDSWNCLTFKIEDNIDLKGRGASLFVFP